eukprot:TRINITY_DN9720_c0_g1_i1.p2 TRINITY_DN9720_c0_g1~~TRINITY_DN9720_c0_g1_i1.p2  ORF type:complete len:106 (-),score=34.49 TRINITY_DN9720_c0_g1_i1:42-359(-)
MVACMIPKGNMMASTLKKTEDQNGFKLVNFNCSNKKETPRENKDLETDFKAFLGKGICSLAREGKSLSMTAGSESRYFTQDDVLTKQEEERKAKLMSAKGSGRFG